MVDLKEAKEQITEIAAIAKECPENFQQLCFQLLMQAYLDSTKDRNLKHKHREQKGADTIQEDDDATSKERDAGKQEDIKDTDIHVKVRKFLKTYTLTIEDLNQVFYVENGEIKPLYEDLATTKASEGQLRIAELQALRNALMTGEFMFEVEAVRAECKDRKYYDQGNFTATFKNNATRFDTETFDKNTKSAKLSEEGKKDLAEVIKQIK